MMPTPVIEIRDMYKYFPIPRGFLGRKVEYLKAVDGVSLKVHMGETLGLVGESGCGKSTVGYLILRLLRPDKGLIFFQDTDITTLAGEALRKVRRNMQVVFQDPQSSLDPRMLIKKTVGSPLEVNRLAKGAEVVTRVKDMLKSFLPVALISAGVAAAIDGRDVLVGRSSWLADRGVRAFRGDQIFQWIYQRQVDDFDHMTNLGKALRADLAAAEVAQVKARAAAARAWLLLSSINLG